MHIPFFDEGHDRHEAELLHDAFKMRLKFGSDAEAFCLQSLQNRGLAPKRGRELSELLAALRRIPNKIATYRSFRRLPR